ncbi:MAG: ferrous iron transport protein A, partial [Oscillospiraceae bacterium]|nr:ferrous iron transport protein A [Oscillospiraceae bacterium]
MKDVTTLDRLAVGQRAAVTEVSAPEDQRRRLQELGFVPGGVVSAVQESP